ncbi:MAG: hypothetical protein KKC68_03375 [Candidatus Thermoplasmatota archaeon]|nr:hypothetical protein [Candidatus Thermoplasmatota archaeon]MBU1940794.1 hypothetical protein [Candidatus Thermoplasmatota archaeon]
MKTNKYSQHLVLILLIIISTCVSTALCTTENESWDLILHFNEEHGTHDSITFGEAPNALDISSPDSYDMPKPPAPIPPCIYAWFSSNYAEPYDKLLTDYRTYPDKNKTWDLNVLWIPADYNSSTAITISWNPTNLSASEYTTISLVKKGEANPLANMLSESAYTFSCPANIPQQFTILSSQSTDSNSTPFPSFFIFICAVIITLYFIKRIKT